MAPVPSGATRRHVAAPSPHDMIAADCGGASSPRVHAQHCLSAADLPARGDFDRDVLLTLPLISALLWLRAKARNYLYWQVEWSTLHILPFFVRLRSSKVLHTFFVIASLCGEEEFYMLLIPCLMYNTGSNCVWARGLIFVFIWLILFGDWLKSVLTLPRPPLRWLSNATALDADALDNRDFGWPSTHAAAALAVPFFLIHEFGASLWQVYSSGGADSGWTWSAALALNALALCWTLSISVSRMYLAIHSPADVQGGLLFAAVTLRLWFWYGPTWWTACMEYASLPVAALAATVGLLLVTPRPVVPVVNYTFLEACNLAGFLHGHFWGAWLRWNAQPVDVPIAQFWSPTTEGAAPAWRVALLRNAFGFVFFIVTHLITKKVFFAVCASLAGATPLVTPVAPHEAALRARKMVVTKDIAAEPYKCCARFMSYSYLGVMAAYIVPMLLDALELWR